VPWESGRETVCAGPGEGSDCELTRNLWLEIKHQTSVKIVLAYSGGLDTSILLAWLKQNYDAEIIAFCADIGQEEELDGLTEKALRTGAAKCIIEDLREEFARDFIFPMFQAGAIYEGQYVLGTGIARPLIAKQNAWWKLRALN
jgi:argininosuccinate synthase